MKPLAIFLFVMACGIPLQAQEDNVVKLVGSVAHNASAESPPASELPKFIVQSTIIQHLEDRKVIMQRVADPGLPDQQTRASPTKEELEELRASSMWQERIAIHKSTKLILLSATVVDGRMTFIRWYHEGNEYQAWSNVDFNHFSGFAEFESDHDRYGIMMAVGNISTEKNRKFDWLGKTPELGVDYPAFTLVKGDKSKLDALTLLIALHELYENEKDKLVAAHEERIGARAEREAWLRANPPQPQDTVIQFWRRDESSQTAPLPTVDDAK